MEARFHYDSAAIAIAELNRQGYSIDFNLEANRIAGPHDNINVDDFHIRDIYRYEGDSDPANEMIIYAIESLTGDKGIFVAAYGIAHDESTALFIARLKNAD